MDTQMVINVILGCAGFLGGWILNSITRSINRIEDRLQEMPGLYLTKEDYRDDLKRVYEMLDKIFCKLDKKVDR